MICRSPTMRASTTGLLPLLLLPLLLLPLLLPLASMVAEARGHVEEPCRQDAPDAFHLKRMNVPEELLRLASALQGRRRQHEQDAALPPCPSRGGVLPPGSPLQERSISPWTYRLNRKADRVPEVLPEAACLCAGCVEPHSGRETHSVVSVPVTAHVRVLYRERGACEAGHARYEERWEEIAVGCTCAVYAVAK